MRLTSERCSGIKEGYWTNAKKDELVQRLGWIEHQGPKLIQAARNKKCLVMDREQRTPKRCSNCELYPLARVIGGIA